MSRDEQVKHISNIGSGQPTMRGILVEILFGRFTSGETIAEIAKDYGITSEEVETALRYWASTREKE